MVRAAFFSYGPYRAAITGGHRYFIFGQAKAAPPGWNSCGYRAPAKGEGNFYSIRKPNRDLARFASGGGSCVAANSQGGSVGYLSDAVRGIISSRPRNKAVPNRKQRFQNGCKLGPCRIILRSLHLKMMDVWHAGKAFNEPRLEHSWRCE